MQFDSLRVRKASFFCAVLCCLISSDAVVAAEWSIEPSIRLREEYNDNIHLTTAPHSGVWQTSLSPSVKLSSKTEVTEVSGLAQIGFNRFTGEQGLNRNDKLFSLLASLQSERNTWAMNASYKQDSTADSERVATGIVQARTQRSVLGVNPSWTRTLTERVLLKLDYGFQDVKFESHVNLNDYTFQQVGGALQYRLSERDTVSLSVNYSKTDYAPKVSEVLSPSYLLTTTANKADVRNVQLGIDHAFSETLSGSVALGMRKTLLLSEQSQAVCLGCFPLSAKSETHGTGSSFSAKLEKKFEAAKVSGFASREAIQSGSGLVETDRFGMSLNKDLTEAMTGAVDAILYRTRYIGSTSPGSRYFTFEPRLSWRFMEWWTLDSGYRYARSESDATANAAISNVVTANTVYLNLIYNWPKMAISR